MAVGDAYVFPGFLTPVLTQLFLPKPPTTFLTCFCRGENTPQRKVASTGDRTHNHQVMSRTCSPLSHPGGAISVISWRQFTLFMSFLGFTSTRLGSEMTCRRTLPRKNPEDPVRLESRTPGLQVKHFTTESRGIQQNMEAFIQQQCHCTQQH